MASTPPSELHARVAAFLAVIEEAAAAMRLPAPLAALLGRGVRGQFERKSELELRSEFTEPGLHQRMRAIHAALGALLAELETKEPDGDSDIPPAA